MTPEDALANYCFDYQHGLSYSFDDVLAAMKQYGDQRATEMRDKTLDLLSKHILDGGALGGYWKDFFEDKVLSFNVHPDLQP